MKILECVSEIQCSAKQLESYADDQVVFSGLFNSKNEEVSVGCGNGQQAREKSFAEALEHAFFMAPHNEVKKTGLRELLSQPELVRDALLPTLRGPEVITTTKMQTFGEVFRSVQVPYSYLSLRKDHPQVSDLNKFCSSSGCSFQTSLEKALTHGLLELIERHEFSLMLAHKILSFRINTLDLDPKTQVEISHLEKKFRGQVLLLRTESLFGAFTTVAVFYPEDRAFPLPQAGQKTRFSHEESIRGALLELKQILYLYSEAEQAEDRQILGDVTHIQKFKKQIFLDEFKMKPLLSRTEFQGKTEFQLDQILIALRREGYQPLFRLVKEFKNGCCVVQTFIPGFEKFNLVRLGADIPFPG